MTSIHPFAHPLTHEDLLTLARKVEAAAHDGDRERLETATLHLFEGLVTHVGAERASLLALAPAESRLLERGQQRVVELLVELAADVQMPGPCRCEAVAQELLARLSLLAADEPRSLGNRQSASG